MTSVTFLNHFYSLDQFGQGMLSLIRYLHLLFFLASSACDREMNFDLVRIGKMLYTSDGYIAA